MKTNRFNISIFLSTCTLLSFCNSANIKNKAPLNDSLQITASLGGRGVFLDTISVIYIAVTIHNPSSDTMRFGSMTCSYEDFFTVSSPSYRVQSRYDCFSNYPNIITLPPKTKTDRYIMISQTKKGDTNVDTKFRIGMFYIKGDHNITLDSAGKFYQNRYNEKAIWGNELDLKRFNRFVY